MLKKIKKLFHDKWNYLTDKNNPPILVAFLIISVLVITSLVLGNTLFKEYSYDIGNSKSLLTPINEENAKNIKYNSIGQAYEFNNNQSFSSDESIKNGTSNVSIVVYEDPKKGAAVTDSVNNISFKLTPAFNLQKGKQDGNRIVFPLSNNEGWLVYTIQNTGLKEDIILDKLTTDQKTYEYKLDLGSSLVAKIENDGSIGVYGNKLLSSNISTGTEQDANILQKARENAEKNDLLFNIPKPIIIEYGGKKSDVKANFKINKNILSLEVSGLSKANYPLSIDPSIYVATAQQFMSGNNETNINFNVEEQLIEKGRTTGARFDAWNTTTSLPTPSWGSGNVAAGGFIYSVGGTSFSGKVYNTQGSDTFVVPTGVTSITVKVWGAGGGGGGGGRNGGDGGSGGGGGYTEATLSVTPGETLNLYIGGGGSGGIYHSGGNDAGGGGGGGGYSSIYRGSTPLLIAAGGAGGGGARDSRDGGNGGAGGGTDGIDGVTVGYARYGSGGTQSAGGAGGVNTSGNDGSAGSYLSGGNGGDGRTNDGADGSGASGGLEFGGNGGQPNINTTRAGGGGGGAGYYGGGGGAATRSNTADAGGGGGGGSSYIVAGATSTSNQSGSGINPGNSSDAYRNGAGNGGNGGVSLNMGDSGANGLVAITYGAGTTVSASLNWAKFNTIDGSIESANPGNGVCSGWCTTAAYDLPDERTNFSLVAYNGFLYALGGKDSAGNRQNSVYIAKLGANGEPQLWHPTSSDKATWTYWYQDGGLNSIRSDFSAVAYNNKMYIIGGLSTSGAVNSVHYADITATGKLGTWNSGTNLPYNLYGHSSQVYNDRLYIIGGANSVGGSPLSSVYYNILNQNGSLNNWIQTTSFDTGRITNGGNFSIVWGAYIYISGGCSSVNASGYCTNVRSDTQVSSINADGSIDSWNAVGNISSQRMGFGMIAWRDRLYEIGGCSSQNTSTGDCNTAMLDTIFYSEINQDGDASTVAESVASGTAPCSGSDPYGCNLPGTSYIGNMLSVTVITNGYLYVIGGCTNNTCSTTSSNVAYVAISSTGQISRPAVCPTGSYQGNIWCVDTTNTVSGGIAASSPVVFGGRLYLVGGLNGSANKNTIFRTDLNSDGSISAWTSQTMTGVGATSVSYNYAYARANPASASTNPGNLYIFGGCTTTSAAGCTAYAQQVYKCNIQTTGAIASCSTSGQQQIGTIPGATGTGLGIMSGTVYANYVYLIGGVAPGLVDLNTVRYAKIDNNNNVVAVSGSSWFESPSKMVVGRRRADAFGYNGYIYVVGGFDATAGVLADIEFVKVNVSDGSLGTDDDNFHVSSVTINQRWGLSVPVSNSYAYVIGGCTIGDSPSGCTTRTDVVQTFQIYNNDSGAPAGFSNSNNTYTTNPNRTGASSAILNGYLYTAGGCISETDCTLATNNVSYAPIDINGYIGSWSNTTASLPANRTWGELETAGGSLYYIGGQSNTATDERSEVYYTTPSSGNVTSWSTATNSLPAARTKFGSTVWNNRLYVIGGLDSNANDTTTVYVSPQLNNGGNITSSWSTASTSFNVARSNLSAIAYANNLYIFGGYDGANYLSDVQYSKIDPLTGNAGSWTYTSSLESPMADADGFAANGYIYLMGGRSNSTTCDPATIVAPVSANTTIASGNNPTGVGAWYETNQRYTGARYGSSAVYFDGKAYILGGAACNNTSNRQSYSSSGSQNYVVPENVTSLTVKVWGAGGGGGAGGSAAPGGAGGGGGYVNATIPVTPGETLTLYVGGGGGAGTRNTAGGGGGGGGYSSIYRGSTPLIISAGGGGGGGGRATASHTGGAGGAGGGTTGENGGDAGGTGGVVTGGGAGTPTSGGTAGTGGLNVGTNGSSLNGGLGANGRNSSGADGSAGNGGAATGGSGGSVTTTTYAAGGGGGAGYYGGGGGSASNGTTITRGGSGGGGGSGYSHPSNVTLISNTAGSGNTPGNSGDSDRGTSGNGGNGGSTGSIGSAGSDGLIIIDFNIPQIQQSTLLSQPMVAKYSTVIDTDSDVFPSYWLLNGVDNSVGASWRLTYRSMTDTTTLCTSPAMTTWGSNTLFGNVTLGLPGIYTPLNGSGVNTNCARFFNFIVTVDSSQAFGYPDDVSRGPTITDLTLQFTADPSKRLMHGRTFTGGLQQPLDTPYYSY